MIPAWYGKLVLIVFILLLYIVNVSIFHEKKMILAGSKDPGNMFLPLS